MPRPPWKHMSPYDIPLFGSFVLSPEGRRYKNWEFDVRVGPATDPGPAYDPSIRQDALMLSRVRIDAVGYDGADPTLFEVKPDARLSALGQMVAYKYFFCKDKGMGCKTAIITDTFTPYSKEIYEHAGIQLYLVRPATPQQLLEALRVVCPSCPLLYEDIAYLYEDRE